MEDVKDAIDQLVDAKIRNGELTTIDYDTVVTHVQDETDVSENIAEMYVRDYANVEKHGTTRVVTGMDGEDMTQYMDDDSADDDHAQTATDTEATDDATAAKATAASETSSDLSDIDAVDMDEIDEDHLRASQLTMAVGNATGEVFAESDDGKGGLTVLEDSDHPLIPDVEQTYLRREQAGDTTDIENIADFMEDPDAAVLLVGETGTGKDFAIKYICSETHRPMIRVNFGVGVRYEDLVGGFEPRTVEAKEVFPEIQQYADEFDVTVEEAIKIHGMASQFEFVPGVLYMAVKYGWTFVADEINAAGGEATMPLHGVTEDRDSRELVVRQTGEVIKPHPEFKFVGTMNPPTYAGTKPLNDAFKTRFWPVRMDYLPEPGEAQLIVEAATYYDRDDDEEKLVFPNADKSNLQEEGDQQNEEELAVWRLCELLSDLRDAYKSGDNVTPISHREALKIAKLSRRMGMKSAASYILGNIAADEDKTAVRKKVDTVKFPDTV